MEVKCDDSCRYGLGSIDHETLKGAQPACMYALPSMTLKLVITVFNLSELLLTSSTYSLID